MDAARFWASGGAVDAARLNADLAAFGLAGAEAEAPPEFELFEENLPTVEMFLEARTQWRAAGGMGGLTWLGLDYAGVEALLQARHVRRRGRVFEGLRAMESAALPVLNRKA